MSEANTAIPDPTLASMPFSAEEWAQTPPAVQEFVLALLAQVQMLEAELAPLRERMHRNSRNSSRPPSSDGPENPRLPRPRPSSKRQRGAQPGHPGTTRSLVPVEQVKAVRDLKPAVCRRCGHELAGADPAPQRHQVTEIPPVVAEVTEYRLHALPCPACGTATRATLPAGVPASAFGPHLQAMVALLSGQYHLSQREITTLLADFFQTEVGLGSVSALEQRTSATLSTPVSEARAYVPRQPAVNVDETGWREANQRAWLWVAAAPQVTVFLIRRSRGGAVAKELLGTTFQGIVGSDRWSAYNWLAVHLRQLCWGHLQRDFQAFVERGGTSQRVGAALLAQVAVMFHAWHRVRAGTLDHPTFQHQMPAVQQRVGELLREGAACDHPQTAGTCRDILRREAALWTFVPVAGVEPTNNLAERQIRPGVLWRNSSFGTQSEAGSRFVERLMTVVATLKQQRRNVLAYLTAACDAANWGRPAPSLLPDRVVPAGSSP